MPTSPIRFSVPSDDTLNIDSTSNGITRITDFSQNDNILVSFGSTGSTETTITNNGGVLSLNGIQIDRDVENSSIGNYDITSQGNLVLIATNSQSNNPKQFGLVFLGNNIMRLELINDAGTQFQSFIAGSSTAQDPAAIDSSPFDSIIHSTTTTTQTPQQTPPETLPPSTPPTPETIPPTLPPSTPPETPAPTPGTLPPSTPPQTPEPTPGTPSPTPGPTDEIENSTTPELPVGSSSTTTSSSIASTLNQLTTTQSITQAITQSAITTLFGITSTITTTLVPLLENTTNNTGLIGGGNNTNSSGDFIDQFNETDISYNGTDINGGNESDNAMSGGAIAGLTIGLIAALCTIYAVIQHCKNSQRQEFDGDKDNTVEMITNPIFNRQNANDSQALVTQKTDINGYQIPRGQDGDVIATYYSTVENQGPEYTEPDAQNTPGNRRTLYLDNTDSAGYQIPKEDAGNYVEPNVVTTTGGRRQTMFLPNTGSPFDPQYEDAHVYAEPESSEYKVFRGRGARHRDNIGDKVARYEYQENASEKNGDQALYDAAAPFDPHYEASGGGNASRGDSGLYDHSLIAEPNEFYQSLQPAQSPSEPRSNKKGKGHISRA